MILGLKMIYLEGGGDLKTVNVFQPNGHKNVFCNNFGNLI